MIAPVLGDVLTKYHSCQGRTSLPRRVCSQSLRRNRRACVALVLAAYGSARRRGCGTKATIQDEVRIAALGADGPSRKELEAAAAVVAHSFFVAMCDNSWPRPSEPSMKKIQQEVYDDLATRYTPPCGPGCLLLALKEGAVVGCVGLEVMPFEELPVSSLARLSAERPPRQRVAYMSNLSVRQEQRGQGLGRRLVLEAECWAQQVLRVREVILLVSSKNHAAQRLYVSLGYQLAFKDPWALRAVPADDGINRIRVTNVGYVRTLSLEALEALEEPKATESQAPPWSVLKDFLGAAEDTSTLSFDLTSDYVVAIEQAAVGHSSSLGAQLMLFTAMGQTLPISGRRQRSPPSRVRWEVHSGHQIVGLEVEFGRLVGLQTAMAPEEADLEL
ncbi:unnamed protein product [Effrenium voratum]|nr:unnamed protein product [Effrenium voratum]